MSSATGTSGIGLGAFVHSCTLQFIALIVFQTHIQNHYQIYYLFNFNRIEKLKSYESELNVVWFCMNIEHICDSFKKFVLLFCTLSPTIHWKVVWFASCMEFGIIFFQQINFENDPCVFDIIVPSFILWGRTGETKPLHLSNAIKSRILYNERISGGQITLYWL